MFPLEGHPPYKRVYLRISWLCMTITLDRGTCKHTYILDFTRAVRAVMEMKHSKRRFFHRMPPKTALSLFDMHARCIPTQKQ